MPPSALLEPLARPWRRHVDRAAAGARWALLLATVTLSAHLARLGTSPARLGTAAILLAALALALIHWRHYRSAWRSARGALSRVLLATDRRHGERTLRALTLVEQAELGTLAGSPALAALHFERLLGEASVAAVERVAARNASRWRGTTLGLVALSLLVLALGPARVLEGLDVLFARGGRAPVPLVWLVYPRVTSEPPGYLRRAEGTALLGSEARQPQGSLITVSGAPTRSGRRLVLTDGVREVPFVSDGKGGVIARWTLSESAELRVAARFGQVLISEAHALALEAVPDLPPKVELAEAPKTLELRSTARLELTYAASDDHGLKQLDLVLRSGNREDRRVLSRLDGESRLERGGHVLHAADPFLRQVFLPVLVTVEAKDNDPLRGPKWGASQAITLVPPAVGEPEGDRHAALIAARDVLVDLLALEMQGASAAELRDRIRDGARGVREAVDGTYGGLTVPDGLRTFLAGQAGVLERPLRSGESLQRKSEDALLAIDVAVQGLAARDARKVALRLAEVADEIAGAAKQARETEQVQRGLARLDASIGVLERGARQLGRLGALGRDLGSVALADLGRVSRARARDDLTHTELAARHLADRLRRPNPSFTSAHQGGVESGGKPALDLGQASRADREFDELARELAELAREHGTEISADEAALAEAERQVDLDAAREEAKQRAQAVREAARGLPLPGAEPGSARASASLAREHAEAMAESMERLSLGDAVQSGRDAVSALEEARRKAETPNGPSDWIEQQPLAEAERRLRAELGWAEQQLERLRREAASKARKALGESGEREQRFARRAGNLAGRGKNAESALPQEMVQDLERAEGMMLEAARELGAGNGERALELMRQSQRLLERSDTGSTEDSSEQEQRGGDGERGRRMRTDGEVPEEAKNRAEEFRRRVLRGLGENRGGRLGPAVKRYTEGLLR